MRLKPGEQLVTMETRCQEAAVCCLPPTGAGVHVRPNTHKQNPTTNTHALMNTDGLLTTSLLKGQYWKNKPLVMILVMLKLFYSYEMFSV